MSSGQWNKIRRNRTVSEWKCVRRPTWYYIVCDSHSVFDTVTSVSVTVTQLLPLENSIHIHFVCNGDLRGLLNCFWRLIPIEQRTLIPASFDWPWLWFTDFVNAENDYSGMMEMDSEFCVNGGSTTVLWHYKMSRSIISCANGQLHVWYVFMLCTTS